ncbi:hypothetical protein PV08_05524 [Exophiala spinifera]|uniref:Uncharacterized protein n=1 Tax=Exophiala spinifera TaxID=91928 RepID=A0A0D2B999_9EURO|nr:uncharacterized protein PV08_05524 [Exophiala spinifera]KIW15478.1 hypothetical protein PV08_05524 [Exophiala spinifera]
MFLSSDPAIPKPASIHAPSQDQSEGDSEVVEGHTPWAGHVQSYPRAAAMPSHRLEEHDQQEGNKAQQQYNDYDQLPSTNKRPDSQDALQASLDCRLGEGQVVSAQTTMESRSFSKSVLGYPLVSYTPTIPYHTPSDAKYEIKSPMYYPPKPPTRSPSSLLNEGPSQPETVTYQYIGPDLSQESKANYPVNIPTYFQDSNALNPSFRYSLTSQNHIDSVSFDRMAPVHTTLDDHLDSHSNSPHQGPYGDPRTPKEVQMPVDLGQQQTSAEEACWQQHSQAEAHRQTRPSDLDSLFDGSSGVGDVLDVSEQPGGATGDLNAVQKDLSPSGARDIDSPESTDLLKSQDGAGLGLDSQQRKDNPILGLPGTPAGDDLASPLALQRQRSYLDRESRLMQSAADRFRNILAANGIKCDLVPDNLARVLESAAAEKLTEGIHPQSHQEVDETIEHKAPGNCGCCEPEQNCRCVPCACQGCDCAEVPDYNACCSNKSISHCSHFQPQPIERSPSGDDTSVDDSQVDGETIQEPLSSSAAWKGQSQGDMSGISDRPNVCLPPSRPDTPRPPLDRSTLLFAHELVKDHVRQSVEPEFPVPNWIRESTPAYEDRSNNPSPISRGDSDIQMQNASDYEVSSPGQKGTHFCFLKSPEPTSVRTQSPAKPAPPPIPDDIATLKQPKRSDRRKSAVQSGKVEKRSATGSRSKGVPKSRNVTRKPTTSMGKLIEQPKKGSPANDQDSLNQEAQNSMSVGTVAAAVQKIEEELKKQKDGTPVRRSQRANKGVRTLLP